MNNTYLNALKTGCVKIRIKEGMLASVYKWKDHLNAHREEVLESLKQEGVFIESVFLDRQANHDYLIYYMKFQNPEKAKDAFIRSELNIDKYHAQFKQEAWAERQELELLLDFINAD
jgi:hypothetical protein